MKAPVIVCEQGGLLFFKSVDDAESYLEAIDVDEGRYTAYDREGKNLRLTTVDEQRPVLFGVLRAHRRRVRIEPERGDARPAGSLRQELLTYLRGLDIPADQLDESGSLDSLMNLAIKRVAFTK